MTLVASRRDALAGLSVVVAELYDGSINGTLDRLRRCAAAEECRRVFYRPVKAGDAAVVHVYVFAIYRSIKGDELLVGTTTMKTLFKKFLADETAATAIEYGLIAAGIALAIIAAVKGLGTTLNGKFASINSSLK